AAMPISERRISSILFFGGSLTGDPLVPSSTGSSFLEMLICCLRLLVEVQGQYCLRTFLSWRLRRSLLRGPRRSHRQSRLAKLVRRRSDERSQNRPFHRSASF